MDFENLKNELPNFKIKVNFLSKLKWKQAAKFINDDEEILFCDNLTNSSGDGTVIVTNKMIYATISERMTMKNIITPIEKVTSACSSIKGVSYNDSTSEILLPLPRHPNELLKAILTKTKISLV